MWAGGGVRLPEQLWGPQGVSGSWAPLVESPCVTEPVLFTASFSEAHPLSGGVKWGGVGNRGHLGGDWAAAAILPTGEKPPSGLCPVFCRVYMPDHSYVTIRSRLSASVQDILGSVTEKLQYSEEPAGREDSLILVAVASSGGEGQKELGWGATGGETHKPSALGRGSRLNSRPWQLQVWS